MHYIVKNLMKFQVFVLHIMYLPYFLASCEDGQVRLVKNSLQYSYASDADDVGRLEEDGYVGVVVPHEELRGRLEVCLNQRWGTIHIFDRYVERSTTLAEVACRQLGFSPTCM